MKLVVDTNVLIDGFEDDFSAPAKLVTAVRDGEIEAIVTHQIVREYKLILRRLIQNQAYKDRIDDFLSMVTEVQPAEVNDVVIDDKEDIKFIRAAVGGKADVIVTNDRHLLDIGEIGSIRILKPTEAWAVIEEDGSAGGGAWSDFVRGLGIMR